MTSPKGFMDLDIYQLSFEMAIKIYQKSLNLPQIDKFEVGSQIRRSSQGIKDAIVEGYGRKRYKNDFIKFLVYAHASSLEAISQANFLDRIHPQTGWDIIGNELNKIGIKVHNFIEYVEKNWKN